MSEYERPDRVSREPTIEDLRQLMGASAPHFALHIRNRISHLVDGLPGDHPVRREADREIGRLTRLALDGEHRGTQHPEELDEMPALQRPD